MTTTEHSGATAPAGDHDPKSAQAVPTSGSGDQVLVAAARNRETGAPIVSVEFDTEYGLLLLAPADALRLADLLTGATEQAVAAVLAAAGRPVPVEPTS